MKIGVISDTHLKRPSALLEKVVEAYFQDVDLILHAGDLTSLEVLDVFKGKQVVAVAGNNDSREVKRRLPAEEVIRVNHLRIGLIHGWGLPMMGIERRIGSLFSGIDCLVYGHTHWAVNHSRNGLLYFNPGAFSGGISSFWRRRIGFLHIAEEIRGEIIRPRL